MEPGKKLIVPPALFKSGDKLTKAKLNGPIAAVRQSTTGLGARQKRRGSGNAGDAAIRAAMDRVQFTVTQLNHGLYVGQAVYCTDAGTWARYTPDLLPPAIPVGFVAKRDADSFLVVIRGLIDVPTIDYDIGEWHYVGDDGFLGTTETDSGRVAQALGSNLLLWCPEMWLPLSSGGAPSYYMDYFRSTASNDDLTNGPIYNSLNMGIVVPGDFVEIDWSLSDIENDGSFEYLFSATGTVKIYHNGTAWVARYQYMGRSTSRDISNAYVDDAGTSVYSDVLSVPGSSQLIGSTSGAGSGVGASAVRISISVTDTSITEIELSATSGLYAATGGNDLRLSGLIKRTYQG